MVVDQCPEHKTVLPMTSPDPFQDAWLAQERGDFRSAEEGYRRILQKESRSGRVWLALGSLCADQGRLVEAVASFRQVVEVSPREVQGHLRLGNALLQSGNYAESETAYRRCLELQPENVDAMVNLGFVLGELTRFEDAIACYKRARQVSPGVPEVHHNLGNMLRELKRHDEALACYDEALRLRPDYVKAYVNKGVALAANGAVAESIACLRRAIEIQPDFAEAHNTLGHSLSAEGHIDAAIAEFERAIQLKSDYADPYWNRSLLWLLLGDFERGWPAVEWRWRCKNTPQLPALPYPRWDGSSLTGRTILLHSEQGLGDTLHFARYAPLVKALGARVIVQCQGILIPLLSRSAGIDELIAWGQPSPTCDFWLPMMSLPGAFKTTLLSVPADIPYLFADPALVEHWRQELAPISGLRVGIAWQGSTRHPWDRYRSVPLKLFEQLARIPGVKLVSLQKSPGTEQLQDWPSHVPLIRLSDQIDHAGAFTDTAAIVKNLDLIVTIDSAIAHLAGGLGVPAWIVLHRTPDWRWMLDRHDSPWYPTVRLFRQLAIHDWEPVFSRIAEELAVLAAAKRNAQTLFVEVSAGELLDKLTILHIKAERIADTEKLHNVKAEIDALAKVRAAIESTPALGALERKLKEANEQLWEIEDAIREHEQRKDFGAGFIELARTVYLTNDRRASLKREINALLKSRLVEEKSYAGVTTIPTSQSGS
jgi:tetratricopeptide (TPR) repeat protein